MNGLPRVTELVSGRATMWPRLCDPALRCCFHPFLPIGPDLPKIEVKHQISKIHLLPTY